MDYLLTIVFVGYILWSMQDTATTAKNTIATILVALAIFSTMANPKRRTVETVPSTRPVVVAIQGS